MFRRTVVLAAVLLAGRSLLAQIPQEERIPIRDRDRLAALGFPRDARNVYLWSKADLGGSRAKDAEAIEDPETWGTAVGYSNAFGDELESGGAISLDRTVISAYCLSRYPLDPVGDSFARVPVPDGALLKQFKFWAYDASNAVDLNFRVYEHCQADGPAPQTDTLIGETFTILAIGEYFGFMSLHDFPVDNERCGYTVRVQFADAGQDCAGTSVQAQKLQVSWIRRVSPAPVTATFGDVPTNHAFFQFVEALVKSGVTGGCGGGNYCPDAPLTRGQMAVFLSKALGLQWP